MSAVLARRIQQHCHLPAAETRPPQILCVDDDPDVQTTIELRMREFDVEVQHAFYGSQGIFEATTRTPDLILMDLAMPNGNGEYLLESLRRNDLTAEIPVIVITGMRDPVLKRRILDSGADVFLEKPTRFEDLLHQMSRFIELRRRNEEESI